MCQLVLSHLGEETLNQVVLSILLPIDSFSNFHGTGFLSIGNRQEKKNILYKTKFSADCIPELGLDLLENISTDYPVMAHVRAASKGMPVTDENAHPFAGTRFTLAHNGRLYKKEDVVTYSGSADDTSLASDSETFLMSLEDEAKKNPKAPFLEIINNTMSLYKGKFAFLIHDAVTNKMYVCRGSTAELHWADILEVSTEGDTQQVIGFVVNTKKTDLEKGLALALQACQITSGRRLYASDVAELEKNTVYVVDGTGLEKVGELKENPVTYATSSATYWSDCNGSKTSFKSDTDTSIDLTVKVWNLADKILKYKLDHRLSIEDVDYIFEMLCGYGMGSIGLEDMMAFVGGWIPVASATKKQREWLGKNTDSAYQILPYMYGKIKGLRYPWMLSEKTAIDQLFKFIKDQKKGADK